MTQAISKQLGLFQKQKIAQQSEVSLKPYYTQTYGAAYLGDSLELIKDLKDCSVSLILTSPPFALTRKKEYGNQSAEKYVDWFFPLAYGVQRILLKYFHSKFKS